MTDTLRFDEQRHEYWLGNERIPGVSEVLALGGFDPGLERIDPAVLTLAGERGTYAHLACEYFDRGCLDWDTLDPQLVPYVRAWAKFREVEDFTPILDWMERPIVSRRLRVAGKPDAPGYRKGRPTMADRKTGTVIKPAMALQLAAYVLDVSADQPGATDGERHWPATPALWTDDKPGFHAIERLVVQLKPDGTYRLFAYDDPDDFAVFEAAARIAHWKLRHGHALAASEAA